VNLTGDEMASLQACRSGHEWHLACAGVKAARGGQYPPDWWERVMASGVARAVEDSWGRVKNAPRVGPWRVMHLRPPKGQEEEK